MYKKMKYLRAFQLVKNIAYNASELRNQWSDLAILLFAKNADDENEKCLKIKVFLCISHLKLKKGYPFFNFHSPL